MKSTILLLLLLPLVAGAQLVWTKVTDLPGPSRENIMMSLIGNKLIIAGGLDSSMNNLSEVYSYNLDSNIWIKRKKMPFGSSNTYSLPSSPYPNYFIGGYDSSGIFKNRTVEYLANKDTWVLKPVIPNFQQREYTVQLKWTSKVLVFFGEVDSTGITPTNTVWEYDTLTTIWTKKSSLPSYGRSTSSATVMGDNAYFFGGRNDTNATIAEVWKYNIPSDQWTQLPDIPTSPRILCALYPFQNFIIVASGIFQNNVITDSLINDMYLFDLTTYQYRSLSYTGGIKLGGAFGFFEYNKKCYLYGGYKKQFYLGNFSKDFWMFDPAPLNPVYTDVEEVENDVEATFRLLPNPATSQCTVRFTLPQAAEVTITISDMMGRQLATIDHSRHEQGTSFVPFSTTGYAAGLYLVRVSDGVTATAQQLAIGSNY